MSERQTAPRQNQLSSPTSPSALTGWALLVGLIGFVLGAVGTGFGIASYVKIENQSIDLSCSIDSECGIFEANSCVQSLCVDGQCITDLVPGANCSSTSDCSSNQICSSDCGCVDIETTDTNCTLDSQCGLFEANACVESLCVDGQCITDLVPGANCSSTTDCSANQICSSSCGCVDISVGVSDVRSIPWDTGFTGNLDIEFIALGSVIYFRLLTRFSGDVGGTPVFPSFTLPPEYTPQADFGIGASMVVPVSVRSNSVNSLGLIEFEDGGTGKVFLYSDQNFSEFTNDSWVQGVTVTYSIT